MPTIAVLYWNVHRNGGLAALIADLAATHAVDIVVLGEHDANPAELAHFLSEALGRPWRYVEAPGATKSHVFSRLPADTIKPMGSYLGGRLTLHRLLHQTPEILLGSVHLLDAMNYDHGDQADEARTISERLREVEDGRKHRRTLLIGDFNMNPYHPGMLRTSGFNAVMCARVAAREQRRIGDREYPYFYNPMWGLFGDRTPGPPGTFFRANERTTPYWHMLDQVLIRPVLLSRARLDVRIIMTDQLATAAGRPDSQRASDHLPILATLEVDA